MQKLNILFIALNRRNYIGTSRSHSYYFSQELGKIVNLTVWHDPGDIHDILARISHKPDFILLADMKESPAITGLSALRIPFGVVMHDLHYRKDDRKRFLTDNGVRHIFSIYRDRFYDWYPEFADRMRWLPHYVNPHIYKDYGLQKDIEMLLIGTVHPNYYPLRTAILKRMKREPGFVFHRHPGYWRQTRMMGETYAREINRSKIFLTCNSAFGYTVAKYFEVLACRSLLLAPSSNEILDLGFVPGVHFVEIDEHNFYEKARYYLAHDKERKKITDQGYAMIHRNYPMSRRAAVLTDMIREILNKRNGS